MNTTIQPVVSVPRAMTRPQSCARGACAAELKRWIVDTEQERPICVSPVTAIFLKYWCRELAGPDAKMTLTEEFAEGLLHTAGDGDLERVRAWMLLDWVVRNCAPIWLRAAHRDDMAERLHRLETVDSRTSGRDALITLEQIQIELKQSISVNADSRIRNSPHLIPLGAAEAAALLAFREGGGPTNTIDALTQKSAFCVEAAVREITLHSIKGKHWTEMLTATRAAMIPTSRYVQNSAKALVHRLNALH